MELASLRRDLAVINGGRWVDRTEIRELQDVRIKAKGLGSGEAREALDKLQRDGMDPNEAVQQVINTICLIEIDGLTDEGKPVKVDDVRDRLVDEVMEPLALLVVRAVGCVDATREAKAKALSKN